MTQIYAGIGSRETPNNILGQMERLASLAAQNGWWLRTGNTKGADQAFAKGANAVNPKRVILYLPWDTYESQAIKEGNAVRVPILSEEAVQLVKKLHPNPKALSQGAMRLHVRNVHILLGMDMKSPVDHVVCWTPGGQITGGTGMGLRIAMQYGIPIINLASRH